MHAADFDRDKNLHNLQPTNLRRINGGFVASSKICSPSLGLNISRAHPQLCAAGERRSP